MRREEKFVLSHRPYAVVMDGLFVDREYHTAYLPTVWYRRKDGVTYACVGELWDIQHPIPATAEEFLARHDDGRHGARCHGRWDGERYWGSQDPSEIDRHLGLLRPMLAGFPAIPTGFDGWWTFREVS